MTRTAAMPTAGGRHTLALVAGLDLLTTSERDADRLAHACASTLIGHGATGLTIATHWAHAGDVRHIALSVESGGVDAEALWHALCTQALETPTDTPSGNGAGVLLGDRYTGPPDLREPIEQAMAAHARRRSGRAVVFPGGAALTGTVPVAQVLAGSGIDRVRVLAGGDAEADSLLRTRDFLRPRWEGGQLVLHTQRAAGGTLVPFETPFPTPCCAYHAQPGSRFASSGAAYAGVPVLDGAVRPR